ncbi:MAG: UvrD-helicase domain-containing protein [Candidatus Pacebacteria bacterium]|nr:UvrD-helicase domain-containing protein [Candidatus Paceibacterota bacterium]
MNQELNEKQKEAAEHKSGPLLITAGAGSGKTRTLVNRVMHLLNLGIKPGEILAITFTNKAADEMRSRILKSKILPLPKTKSDFQEDFPFIGTFHSFGAKILKSEAPYFGRTKNFTIFDSEDSLSLIKRILKEKDLPKERFNPLAIAAKISNIKSELEEPEESETDARLFSIFKTYEHALQKNNAFDFDDLIEKPVRIFQKEKAVLEKYQNKFSHVLVDEYQDINTSQYFLIKLLSQIHKNIFVIGDDAQSIYSFRGSDFRIFLNFENDWPEAKIIKLEENYRSSANIVNASSFLIKKNSLQKPKDLWTSNEEGDPIKLFAFQNAEEEAWGVCERILELIKNGAKPEEITILYRTNAQSRAIEQALIQSSIPYEIYGGLKFYARKEIKDLIAGLRYAFNPNDSVSKERIEKNFSKSRSRLVLEELPRLSNELNLTELINFFMENTNYLEFLENNFRNYKDRLENIQELINFAANYKDPHEFLESVSLLSSSDGRPKLKQNAVKLMTIHMSKGLEFDNIFIIGCNEGLLPHEQSLFKNDEMEEERRLMYVAMTRARKKLFLSFYNLPSRFLGELPPELIEFQKVTSYGTENKDWDDETIYLE